MLPVQTRDGSLTFFDEEFHEHYHSLSGAEEEAREKYVKPCEIKAGMTVLDICFGLGYNSAAAMDVVDDLKIIALEKDKIILKKILEINTNFKKYSYIQEAVDGLFKSGKTDYTFGNIRFLIGNAADTINKVNEKIDAVFLDPFSPPKNPELWTEEFFLKIKRRMRPGARLATYSCARLVRDNMKKSSLIVEDGPCVGRRSPGTVAWYG